MNKESIKQCAQNAVSLYNEHLKTVYCAEFIKEAVREELHKARKAGPLDYEKAEKGIPFIQHWDDRQRVRDELPFLFAKELVLSTMVSDFGAQIDRISYQAQEDKDLDPDIFEFDLVRFDDFELMIVDPQQADDLLRWHKTNETTLCQRVLDQYPEESFKDLLILMYDPFGDLIDEEPGHPGGSYCCCSQRDDEYEVNIFDLIRKFYEPHRIGPLIQRIEHHKKELSSLSLEPPSFTDVLRGNNGLFCDLFVDYVLSCKSVNEAQLRLACTEKESGRLYDFGVYSLLLSDEEKRTIKDYLLSNIEPLTFYRNYEEISIGDSDDYASKALPLMKMCETTFRHLLTTYWQDEYDGSIHYGDEIKMDHLPIEKYNNALYSDSQTFQSHFAKNQTRYKQLKNNELEARCGG